MLEKSSLLLIFACARKHRCSITVSLQPDRDLRDEIFAFAMSVGWNENWEQQGASWSECSISFFLLFLLP